MPSSPMRSQPPLFPFPSPPPLPGHPPPHTCTRERANTFFCATLCRHVDGNGGFWPLGRNEHSGAGGGAVSAPPVRRAPQDAATFCVGES
eukprot:301685-Chlamydomonas_euryale.AAC.1